MNKTRKTKLYVILIALVCLIAFCLCACSGVGADGANGTNGKDGANGKSAYDIWLDEGHTGSQSDFLNWLKGTDGKNGQNGSNGANGQDGSNGQNGTDGKSAYQIWIDNGHTGTEAEFLDWLKGADGEQGSKGETGATGADGQDGENGQDGANGLSAYEIFLKYYPYYTGTEEQWINSVAKGELKIHKITFKSEVSDDIYRFVFEGYALADIPEVPEKEGQTSAAWSVTDFSSITEDTEVTAVYDMRKYVTFHNEFTDDEDIVKTVEYGEAITDIPQITAKVGNDSKWSVTDFSEIKTDLLVEAEYETQGLQYTLINQQTQYKVSKGEINNQTKELFIPAEYGGKAVTVIDTNAFSYCQFVTAHIPNSVVEIRTKAFEHCSLTSIAIPDSVTNIGNGAFSDCDRLKITTIGRGWIDIDIYVFSGCSGLTSIEVDNNNPNFSSQSGILFNKEITQIIFVPKAINGKIVIPDGVTSVETWAFYNCSSLTSIDIPNSVTSIGAYAFYNCSSLTSIDIPNSVTSIGYEAFYNCSSLTSIEISNSVTNIGSNAFSGCSSLTSVVIPNSVTSIGSNAFDRCSSLETIYYKGTQTEFNNLTVSSDGNTSFTDAMVYFYSQNPPTDDGYYWHYDTDDKTPILWAKVN